MILSAAKGLRRETVFLLKRYQKGFTDKNFRFLMPIYKIML